MPKKLTPEQRAIANAAQIARVKEEIAAIGAKGLTTAAIVQNLVHDRQVGVSTLSRTKIAYEQIYLASPIVRDLFERGLISWKQIRDSRGTRQPGGLAAIEEKLLKIAEER